MGGKQHGLRDWKAAMEEEISSCYKMRYSQRKAPPSAAQGWLSRSEFYKQQLWKFALRNSGKKWKEQEVQQQ